MNVKIRYKCPYCGRSIEHNPAYAGSLVVCSACKGEFYEPTDPLPGRAADKALTRKSVSAKPPIPRNPVGYDAKADEAGEKPDEKTAEPKTPAASAPAPVPSTSAPSGPRLREPKGAQPKETAGSPLGGSLWEQVSDEPKAKPVSKPTSSAPAKMVLPTSSKGQPGDSPSKPAASNAKPTTSPAPSDTDDEEIDFQAMISSELSKPKASAPAASTPKANVSSPVPSKPAAPMARPAASPMGGAPMARPATSQAGGPSGGNALHTATPTDMANELRRRGLFAAIVFGDPTKLDQTQLALSDNMTRDDAKTFIMKLFGISKHSSGDEPKSGGMFGRLFGGGKDS